METQYCNIWSHFFSQKNHIGYFPWDPHEYELLIWLRNKTFGSQWSSIFHTRKHFGHFPRPREKDPYEYELLIWNKAASGFPSFIVRCGDVFIHISNFHNIWRNLGIDENKVLISVDTRARGPHMIISMKDYLDNLSQFMGLLIRSSDSKLAQTL